MNPFAMFGMGRPENKNDPTPQASPKSSRGTTMVDKCGYLLKEGWYRQSWKRRFFKLQDLALLYYTDAKACESQEAPKGVILLRDCEVRISERDGRPHCLEIFHSRDKTKRIYYIAAESEKERHEWVVALTNNIACQATARRLAEKEISQLKQQVAELSEAVTQYERQAEDERVAKELDRLRMESEAREAPSPAPSPSPLPSNESASSPSLLNEPSNEQSQDEEKKQLSEQNEANLAVIEELKRELQAAKAALEQSKQENQDITAQMQKLSEAAKEKEAEPTPSPSPFASSPSASSQSETEHQIPLEVWGNMQGQVLEELQLLRAEVSKLKQEKRILKNEVKRLAQLSSS